MLLKQAVNAWPREMPVASKGPGEQESGSVTWQTVTLSCSALGSAVAKESARCSLRKPWDTQVLVRPVLQVRAPGG